MIESQRTLDQYDRMTGLRLLGGTREDDSVTIDFFSTRGITSNGAVRMVRKGSRWVQDSISDYPGYSEPGIDDSTPLGLRETAALALLKAVAAGQTYHWLKTSPSTYADSLAKLDLSGPDARLCHHPHGGRKVKRHPSCLVGRGASRRLPGDGRSFLLHRRAGGHPSIRHARPAPGARDAGALIMRFPKVHGIIRRRLLVNFRVEPDVIQRHLQQSRPKLHDGQAIAGICLIRLENIRPKRVPRILGLSSENAAHRIAVVWEDSGEMREGVYIPRRDTSS